jgi:hypothetical protein
MPYLEVAPGHVLHGCLDAAEGEEGAAFEHHGAGHKQRICKARRSKERSLWSAQGPATQLLSRHGMLGTRTEVLRQHGERRMP